MPLVPPAPAKAALSLVPGLSGRLVSEVDARLRAALDRHLNLVWRVLRRSGLRSSDAEDAAQDVFWVLAQRSADVPERAERSFLVATALRVAADRRRSKWQRSMTSLESDSREETGPLPDEALDLRRAGKLLDQALEALSEADRSVFILAQVEQLTRAEVAETLGIPEGTVASRLRRARETFEASVKRLRLRSRSRA